MSTQLSPMINRLWLAIHEREPAAENGGSVPNLDTERPHSYHRSWQDSPHDDGYSVHYFGDKHLLGGKDQYAAALDVTLRDPALMERYTARLHHFVLMHPRAYYRFGLREFAGTLDGSTVFAWDCTRRVRTYGWDSSHLWHIHLSINRRFVADPRILRIASVFGP